MNPKKLRAFSLYESQDEGRRGGRSKFRDFLAGVGKTFRPVLNQLASGLASKGTRVLAKKLGNETLLLGSDLLGSVAKGKSVRDVAQSEAAKKLLAKGVTAGLNRIKAGAGVGVLPDDIEEKLTPENRRALSKFVKKKKRTSLKGKKKGVGKRKKGAGTQKKGARTKKKGARTQKKGARIKKKGAGKKGAGKKGAGKAKSKKKISTRGKSKKQIKSIFD